MTAKEFVDEPMTATDGRVIGRRAQATRQRLLDATKQLLAEDGLFELKLVDITREIGASPATFYQYFSDVDSALVALAEEVCDDALRLVDLLKPEWKSTADFELAREFVAAYIAYWDQNGPVLRVRNLKAEEGDIVFRKVRSAAQVPMLEALAAKVSAGKKAGLVAKSVEPVATAAGMLAMLERLTAYRAELSNRGTTEDLLADTLATILFQTVSGLTVES